MNIEDLEDDSIYEMSVDDVVRMTALGSFLKACVRHPKVVEAYQQYASTTSDETPMVFRKIGGSNV